MVGIDYSRFIVVGIVVLERKQYSKFARQDSGLVRAQVSRQDVAGFEAGAPSGSRLVRPQGCHCRNLLLRRSGAYNPNPLRRIGVVG